MNSPFKTLIITSCGWIDVSSMTRFGEILKYLPIFENLFNSRHNFEPTWAKNSIGQIFILVKGQILKNPTIWSHWTLAVRSDWATFKRYCSNFASKVAHFLGYFRNYHFLSKTWCGYLLGNVWTIWATLYSNIWSQWT